MYVNSACHDKSKESYHLVAAPPNSIELFSNPLNYCFCFTAHNFLFFGLFRDTFGVKAKNNIKNKSCALPAHPKSRETKLASS